MNEFPLVPLRTVTLDAQTGPFGSQLHSDDYIDDGIPVINPSNIINGQIAPDFTISVTEATSDRLSHHRLKPGDLVFARRGELGRAAVTHDEASGWLCGTGSLRVRTQESALESRFAGYVLQSARTRAYFEMYAVGSTMANLNTSIVLGLPIPLPQFNEQRRIADFLDAETVRIDQLASLQQTVRSAVQARVIVQLDIRAEELTRNFGAAPFRRMIQSIEQGSSPQCDNYPADPDSWGVLKVSAVKGGKFLEDENKQLPADIEPVRRYEIKPGDLLITRANTPQLVGAAAVAEFPRKKLMLCDKIFRIRTNHDLVPEFLVLMSLSTRIRDMCAEASHGTSQSMANLKTEEIKRWPIPQAPIDVQRSVIAELSSARARADALIVAIDHQAAILAERRQALITAAVTGAITV